MFMFEDIVSLEDRAVQLVLRQVDTAELALALKGVADDGPRQDHRATSPSAPPTNLLEEIELLGPVRLRQVEEAQQNDHPRPSASSRSSGEIMVRRGSDDEFVA